MYIEASTIVQDVKVPLLLGGSTAMWLAGLGIQEASRHFIKYKNT